MLSYGMMHQISLHMLLPPLKALSQLSRHGWQLDSSFCPGKVSYGQKVLPVVYIA